MTRAEAQKFLSKCAHRVLWRRSLGDREMVSRIQWTLLILSSLNLLAHLENMSVSRLLICSAIMGLSAWPIFRTWCGYRVLQPASLNQEKCS